MLRKALKGVDERGDRGEEEVKRTSYVFVALGHSLREQVGEVKPLVVGSGMPLLTVTPGRASLKSDGEKARTT